ncbi:hypothetical protein HWV62_33807 [Athelia sp. TMB]|nr:hypothetical protein HWV62_33807 [Athelia sp. TMB]
METLEIEDNDERLARLQGVFEKMNASAGYKPDANTFPGIGARKTDEMPDGEMTSQLLARVKSFLPQIESSNAALASADPAAIDIENVTEEQEGYIEMNLGLGVFEDRKGQPSSQSSDSSSLDSSSESDSDESDSDSESDIITSSTEGISRIFKPLPRRAQTSGGVPMIVEVSSSTGPKRSDFTFHSNEDLVTYRFTADSPMAHKFCGTCGSSVCVDVKGHDLMMINARLFKDIDIPSLKLNEWDFKSRQPAYVPPTVPALPASLESDGKHAYPANCQCGTATYTVYTPDLSEQQVVRCTCSICVMNAYLFVCPKRSEVVWHTGKDDMRIYRFNTGRGRHMFCPKCGSSLLIDFEYEEDELSINVRMFQDIDISTLHFREYDGKNVR